MDRHIMLEAGLNFRDLGGYQIRAGGFTRWHTFFRADSMHRLTTADQTVLIKDYGIRTIIDLRRSGELEERPSVFAQSKQINYLHLNMIGDGDLESQPPTDEGPSRIAWSYCCYLGQRHDAVREILATLAQSECRPAMYHCAAGKDRTGILSAILLGIGGVAEETIAEDYALSAHYLAPSFKASQQESGENMTGFTWRDYQRQNCPAEAMRMALTHLQDKYGGLEAYLETIGMSQQQVWALRDAITA